VGWAKGIELAKLARRDRQRFDCATWLHKARELSKEDFQQAVERELTGKLTEPWEITSNGWATCKESPSGFPFFMA